MTEPRRPRASGPANLPPVTPPAAAPAAAKPRRPAAPPADAAELSKQTSAVMKQMLNDIRVKAGGDPRIAMAGDIGKTLIGIPLPSLALEYALGNTVLPLEKVIQVYGKRGGCKSALGFEIMRWVRRLGGTGNLCENESKYNDDWAMSIMGHESGVLGVVPCDSVNDWQRHLQQQNALMRKVMMGGGDRKKGMGKVFPYLQIVDSIMGKPADETQSKIEKDGSAGRSFPIEALSISRFITTYATSMAGWPFLLVCVNHMKVNAGDQGMDKKSRSGGQTIDFQGSFEIEVNKIGHQRYATSEVNKLMLRIEKNSYGPDKRKIVVNCAWWDEDGPPDEEGRPTRRQKTVFDWPGATVQLLLNAKGQIWTDARKLTGVVGKTATTATSKVLKVTEAAPFAELGRRIHRDEAMMRELRQMLGIRIRRVFQPGVDYDKQMRDLNMRIAKAEAQRKA